MHKQPLWTFDEIATATKAHVLAHDGAVPINPAQHVSGVSIDTRSLNPGDLFVALSGDQSDGHQFLDQAISAGASGVLVEGGHARVLSLIDQKSPIAIFCVTDVFEALWDLARAARARSTAKIIAVTGSVGKTSVKESLKACLAHSGPTHAAVKSYNNHIGVPLTLARMPRDVSFGVFELGMNHAGEISLLSRLVQPHVAIITAIGAAHIEALGSLEAIADAKAEIFDGLIGERIAILPADSSHYDQLRLAAEKQNCHIVSFGQMSEADTGPIKMRKHPTCSCVDAQVQGRPMTYKVAQPGDHHISNSLAVLTAVNCLGADLALAGLELAHFEALSGRGQRHVIHFNGLSFILVDESYNANPTSMRAAISTLANTPNNNGGRQIIVLGDMAELGSMATQLHGELAAFVNDQSIDLVYTCGTHMASLNANLEPTKRGVHVTQPLELQKILEAELRDGDVVMVKGSNSSRMGLVVDHFLNYSEDNSQKELGA